MKARLLCTGTLSNREKLAVPLGIKDWFLEAGLDGDGEVAEVLYIRSTEAGSEGFEAREIKKIFRGFVVPKTTELVRFWLEFSVLGTGPVSYTHLTLPTKA